MKYLLLLTLIVSNAQAQTSSPRETMRTFLKAMVNIKNHEGDNKANYLQAISTLELKQDFSELRYDIGRRYAEQLIHTIDKIKKVDYEQVPETFEKDKWYFDNRYIGSKELEISLIKKDNQWLFGRKTLQSLAGYKKLLKEVQLVDGVTPLVTFKEQLKSKLPVSLNKKIFLLENWQWFGVIFI